MAKPFTDLLRELRYGRSVEEATDLVTQVVAAVRETGKSGSLTVTLKFNPPRKGGISYIEVVDEVSAKIPKPDQQASIFFPTADNGLSKQDPRQGALDLQLVPRRGNVVDQDTGEILEGENEEVSNG